MNVVYLITRLMLVCVGCGQMSLSSGRRWSDDVHDAALWVNTTLAKKLKMAGEFMMSSLQDCDGACLPPVVGRVEVRVLLYFIKERNNELNCTILLCVSMDDFGRYNLLLLYFNCSEREADTIFKNLICHTEYLKISLQDSTWINVLNSGRNHTF